MNATPRLNKTTIGAALLAAVLIIVAIFWAAFNDQKTSTPQETSSEIETVDTLSSALTEKDRDGDGLYDWEESLWQTDPDNSDTDGDGTSDGDEIEAGRNPSVAGPNDALPESPDQRVIDEIASSSEDLTLTNQLARQFFTQYLQAKEAGRTFNAASQEQLLASMLGSASAEEAVELPSYNISDLAILEDPSREDVRTYGNALGEAVARNSFETENELFIMRRALDTRDTEEVEQLKRIAAGYKGIAQDLLATPVPEDAAGRHLTLINNTSAISAVVQGMSGVLEDPLRALLFLEQYEPVSRSTVSAVRDLQEYFNERDVEFVPDEPGFVFQET